MVMKANGSARKQLLIPRRMRERLGLRPGDVLELRERRGHLVATKTSRDPVDRVYGVLKLGAATDQVMRRLRYLSQVNGFGRVPVR